MSLEYIIALTPDVILDGQMGSDPHSPAGFGSRYPDIPAARNRRIFRLRPTRSCGLDPGSAKHWKSWWG